MAAPALALALLAPSAHAEDDPFGGDFTPTVEGIDAAFDGFVSAHPDLVAKTTLATTPRGHELAVYTIGNRASQDHALLLCNHHGDEQWVAQLCLDFSRWLLWANGRDPVATDLLARIAIDVLPIGNPDGFAIGGRYNSAGNDINRNFPFQWGYAEPGSVNTHPGPYAASEPETRALMDFQRAHVAAGGRWLVTLNYHLRYEGSDGTNYILLPWAYTRQRALPADALARYQPFLPVGDEAPTFLVDTVPNVFYPCSGTHTDWTWAELDSPALTMELGHGYQLPSRATYLAQHLRAENLPVFRRFLAGMQATLDAR
jgi:hypothetical protein